MGLLNSKSPTVIVMRVFCSRHWCWLLLAAAVAAHASVRADEHWSYQPIGQPTPPRVENVSWPQNEIDAFVLRRLERERIQPAPPADRVTLIRRVTLDLIGLAPTPSEVRSFVDDARPDAYQRLVDRLLASPHYGERWARSWLDLCHYADSDGYLTDQLRPVAWRYRQWLVDALNRNVPFDQFTVEQLAGDLISGAETQPVGEESSLPETALSKILATGFLRQTLSNREGGADLEEFRVKQVISRTEMVGAIWLGLTVGCARCHDHKYDTIAQREFFELYACLNDADEVNIDAPLRGERESFLASRRDYWSKREKVIAPWRKDLEQLQRRWEAKLIYAWKHPGKDHVWDRQWELLGLVWGGGLGEGQLEGTEIVKLKWRQRSRRQKADLLNYFLRSGSVIDADRFRELKLDQLRSQLGSLASDSKVTRAPVMRRAQTLRKVHIHEAGDFRDPGAVVQPDTLNVLPDWPNSEKPPRLKLARWLVSPRHPLTARVTVNRIWQEFFGRGLSPTVDDFGARGEKPSHPELLDRLASTFRRDWDVKALHRRIVLSATYRQSSRPRPELQGRDPRNALLARQNPLRVSAETVRDLTLSASGLMDARIGGPSVKPPQPARVTMEAFGNKVWKASEGGDRYRRGLYTFILRTSPFAQSAVFDAPNPNEICTRRDRGNTPLQALTLLNDPVFVEMARALAQRAARAPHVSDGQRIDYAFRLCLAREPTSGELARLREFLETQRAYFAAHSEEARAIVGQSKSVGDAEAARLAAWTSLASVLFNLHEFITRD